MDTDRIEETNLYGVIMAGGRGTRFWPASRHKKPKQLLSILGDRPLLRQTVERLLPMLPADRIIVVTGEDISQAVRESLPEIPPENFLLEPEGRNTAPCIGWAALHLRQRAGDPVMAVLPSDHLIRDPAEFRRVLAAASDWARQGEHLVTLAIRPCHPETGYGYIQVGECCGRMRDVPIFLVKGFREKPDRATAESLLEAGDFFWNSGIFVWKTSTILEALERYLPDLYQGLLGMQEALQRGKDEEAARSFRNLIPVSIDYGVIEKAGQVYTLHAEFGWSDLGGWAAVYEQSPKDALGNACRGDLLAVDTTGCLVEAPGKLVALVGVQDLVIVDAGDAMLVCRREQAQQIREVVERLRRDRGSHCL